MEVVILCHGRISIERGKIGVKGKVVQLLACRLAKHDMANKTGGKHEEGE